MDKIAEGLKKIGVPERDVYSLPSSPKRFPDGAHYRLEIAGVESIGTAIALADEMKKRKVTIHRVICTVKGITLLTDSEVRDLAAVLAQEKLEAIVTLGPSRGWDSGRQITTVEGLVSGMRIRGSDNFYFVLKDMERCIEAGFRGFLVVDEGLLWTVGKLREQGIIPEDVIFKVSVFAGHGNPAGVKLLQTLGADTVNPLADLTLPMLASIREAVDIPVDVYASLVDAMGGFHRFIEAAEIARICAPVYFKFEPGQSEGAIYKSWVDPSYHEFLVREKVKQCQIVTEWISRLEPSLKISGPAPADLAIPKP